MLRKWQKEQEDLIYCFLEEFDIDTIEQVSALVVEYDRLTLILYSLAVPLRAPSLLYRLAHTLSVAKVISYDRKFDGKPKTYKKKFYKGLNI